MCLLERREATVSPLNMTLAARLALPPTPLHHSCVAVGVPFGSWSAEVACPNCRHELRVTVAPGGKLAPVQHWCQALSPWYPITPRCTTVPAYLPQSPLYTPLSPILPPQCNEELRRLADTLRALRLSGWYYGNLDWQGARNLLKDASVGAFLIRDSGDRNFIFSLSVQTERGPTSVRLHYEQGTFRLDCDRPLARYMPRFRCVVALVEEYRTLCVGAGGSKKPAAHGTVWVDKEGCPHSPVLLTTPQRKSPPSLLHAARLAIHKAILAANPHKPRLQCAPKHRHLPLPPLLHDYLAEYPYSI